MTNPATTAKHVPLALAIAVRALPRPLAATARAAQARLAATVLATAALARLRAAMVFAMGRRLVLLVRLTVAFVLTGIALEAPVTARLQTVANQLCILATSAVQLAELAGILPVVAVVVANFIA